MNSITVLQFIRFMEIVKKKLPAAQEQIVTKLNLEFQVSIFTAFVMPKNY